MGAAKIERWLNDASRAHRSGSVREARELYHRIMRHNPSHLDANYLLGTLCAEQGELQDAVRLLKQAAVLAPASPFVHNNLGNVFRLQGELDHALACYERALELNPAMAEAHCNAGFVCRKLQRLVEAEAHYRSALAAVPNLLPARQGLAFALGAQGLTAQAAAAYRAVLELAPGDPVATHMMSALSGETTDAAPAGYVMDLFEHYAERFEAHLTRELECRIPQRLRQAVTSVSRDRKYRAMADLGCGTGLAGAAFRDIVGHMVGMDLSPRMLGEAAKKEIYDALLAGDVVERLADSGTDFDLFIAADVFVYLGNLSPVFAAVRERSTPGAVFAFSAESTDQAGFVLAPTGRYGHSREYVRSTAATHGFAVDVAEPGELRRDGGQWLFGHYYVLRLIE
jgi:predicted TPR repeat methyltransferase